MDIFESNKMKEILTILKKLPSLKKTRFAIACKYLHEKEKLNNILAIKTDEIN